MGSTQRGRVGKGGRETWIDAPRRVRRAHAAQLNLPRDFARARRHSPSKTGVNALKSAFAHLTCDPGLSKSALEPFSF